MQCDGGNPPESPDGPAHGGYFRRLTNEDWPSCLSAFVEIKGKCVEEKMKPDADGFPLEPNGNNEWSFATKNPNSNAWNFHTRWAWRILRSKKSGDDKYVVKKCQGILQCNGSKDGEPCNATLRPQTTKGSHMNNKLKCINCGSKNFTWIECEAKMRFDYKGIYYTRKLLNSINLRVTRRVTRCHTDMILLPVDDIRTGVLTRFNLLSSNIPFSMINFVRGNNHC
jgi:hypothetical protein